MAKVKLIPGMVTELHGSLSKDSKYYFKTINGQVRMYAKPKRRVARKPTSLQVDHHERFAKAQAAIQVLCRDEMAKRWLSQLWKNHNKKYSTLRGWLMAELMKQ